MRIIPASYSIDDETIANVLPRLERIARTCYKSEGRITPDSAIPFMRSIVNRRHFAILEHAVMTVRFVIDRGVLLEMRTHRHKAEQWQEGQVIEAAYAAESTRFCNYGKGEVTFIRPCFEWAKNPGSELYLEWLATVEDSERHYLRMLSLGASPQEARSALNNSVKTDLVVTTNLSTWRSILRTRTKRDVHPQFREVSVPLLAECKARIPVLFDDIAAE